MLTPARIGSSQPNSIESEGITLARLANQGLTGDMVPLAERHQYFQAAVSRQQPDTVPPGTLPQTMIAPERTVQAPAQPNSATTEKPNGTGADSQNAPRSDDTTAAGADKRKSAPPDQVSPDGKSVTRYWPNGNVREVDQIRNDGNRQSTYYDQSGHRTRTSIDGVLQDGTRVHEEFDANDKMKGFSYVHPDGSQQYTTVKDGKPVHTTFIDKNGVATEWDHGPDGTPHQGYSPNPQWDPLPRPPRTA